MLQRKCNLDGETIAEGERVRRKDATFN